MLNIYHAHPNRKIFESELDQILVMLITIEEQKQEHEGRKRSRKPVFGETLREPVHQLPAFQIVFVQISLQYLCKYHWNICANFYLYISTKENIWWNLQKYKVGDCTNISIRKNLTSVFLFKTCLRYQIPITRSKFEQWTCFWLEFSVSRFANSTFQFYNPDLQTTNSSLSSREIAHFLIIPAICW